MQVGIRNSSRYKLSRSKIRHITCMFSRNLANTDLMGGKADVIVHVKLGDKEMKTKVGSIPCGLL